ncbi:FGGY-family carbohydrate kinase [Streptomyces sp. NBC_01498]|uniref:rhamnulokinase n=1 Tax=Streptomyces sp. NBC_01498 TaxID=2975870 RepID=UPI002E7B0385|nr:FGGY-family carbohydrate kinase [Streptomyces sp. NBC_01498]WTL28622.1 FGGY-family carbohydrate kinase [Streptomyces sp. NBC_01498]
MAGRVGGSGRADGTGRRGRDGGRTLELTEVHRFANRPVRLPGSLRWDVLGLHRGVLDGLGRAARAYDVASIGIDSWAVDYGLLDADGQLLGNPHHYRDGRTEGMAERVRSRVPADELYRITGLQHLPFNTVLQLTAAAGSAQLGVARTLLMIPDLLTHWLTGSVGAEATNASTTGLFDARAGEWSGALMDRLGIDRGLFPPLRRPGDAAGTLLPYVAAETGLPESTPVTAVASHDTASAVAGVPATGPGFAYVSCGTWSLAGLELAAPVITEASRAANFTNELGLDGSYRFLRNVMGLWLLSESLRTWADRGQPAELGPLLEQADGSRPFAALVDPDDPSFLAPGDMPARIAAYCARTGQRPPVDRAATVRCVLESLALAHRAALRTAAELSGTDIRVVHLVGGGSRNELLCRLTADATGLPVVAGPAEATALGNILVQARAQGLVGDRAALRRLIAATQPLRRYEPGGDARAWSAAAERVGLG